jgi:hypothetical protein
MDAKTLLDEWFRGWARRPYQEGSETFTVPAEAYADLHRRIDAALAVTIVPSAAPAPADSNREAGMDQSESSPPTESRGMFGTFRRSRDAGETA